jgi:DNA repair protein RecN (Recombination protein N)
LEEIQQRLDLIFRLEKKHRVSDVGSLIQIANALQRKIDSISIHTEEIEELGQTISFQRKTLLEVAGKISVARVKQSPRIVQTINSMMKEVGMIHAQIKINHESLNDDELNSSGLDRFEFLFASNKGSAFQEIRKVASGGELSRLMLSFKSLVAASTSLPTLIFDEIDSGISGETAMKVSRILKQLAANHQVICITHLPQLAAKGDTHYFVYKETLNGRTHTRVRSLTQEEKIKTIAQMIAGEKVTSAALESAKELLN